MWQNSVCLARDQGLAIYTGKVNCLLKQKNIFRVTDGDRLATDTIDGNKQPKHSLSTAGLVWVGLGGIIGAGFFLASGLPINQAGPGVIFAYLLGGLLMAQVGGALTSMSVNHPVRGSFRVYAQEFLGSYMGFYLGWAFWVSSILAIGSETTAMAIFARLWLPNVPVWLLTIIFSAIVIALNAFGVKKFGKIESLMSVVKVCALALFVVLGVMAFSGFVSTTRPVGLGTLLGSGGLFPKGIAGWSESMLIVIFAYGGISVVALATSEVEDPKRSIPRAMLWVVVSLIVLYIASLLVIMSLVPWTTITVQESPFVVALQAVNLPVLPSIMNAIILVAAFSVMVGAFFAAMTMLVSLGEAREAPVFVTRKGRNGVFHGSLVLTGLGVLATVTVSYFLPSKVYAYLTSASAYFSFLNWGTILVSFLVWRKKSAGIERYESPLAFGAPWATWASLGVIGVLFIYSLGVVDQRMGFYAALALTLLISAAYFLLYRSHTSSDD